MSNQHENSNFHWGYHGDFGPTNWNRKYPLAASNHQSPINIDTNLTVYESTLSNNPLSIFYDDVNLNFIQNNGHTFQLSGDSDKSSVTGGPTNHIYKFCQFHLHWGNDDKGSEHTIDGKQYAAEIHFVNWNSSLFKCVNEAGVSPNHDGLLVLGVLIQIGEKHHEFEKIIDLLQKIELCGQSLKFNDTHIDMKNFFPGDINSYWTYSGSLTTPPCNQSVKWIVFKDFIEISREQIQSLKRLYKCSNSSECKEENLIKLNYRPICPINERIVYKSFE